MPRSGHTGRTRRRCRPGVIYRLVSRAVLMPLAPTDASSRLGLDGGAHGMLVPPYDFSACSFLPIACRLGSTGIAWLVRLDFCPSGGGSIKVRITLGPLRSVDFLDPGALLDRSALAMVAAVPTGVTDRDRDAGTLLADWPEEAFAVCKLPENQGRQYPAAEGILPRMRSLSRTSQISCYDRPASPAVARSA
ncbi:RNA 3'-terminal phosphate cyclase [Sphingomonas floccifaciens]|uniref:RNA 3'-terminal phosphate cyclase n=1 Tax=Sphingomonas floccifaciens TaxID=1844115 RepID=A0ABW4NFJ8_9SPHN